MEIVSIACVATIALCAVLSMMSRGATARVRKPTRDPLDSAIMHLIDDVTREPGVRVNPSKRQTWV
jgi:microcompartment protein CcmK/EutM